MTDELKTLSEKIKKIVVEEAIPEIWNKIVNDPNSLLVELLIEETKEVCGVKPEKDEVIQFLKNLKITSKPRRKRSTDYSPKKITQEELITYIIKALLKYGGRASKDDVEKEVYHMLADTFKDSWYQEPVAQGIPRWQHNIAWAKERAKNKGLIKRPEESGRGYWELTETGMKFSI